MSTRSGHHVVPNGIATRHRPSFAGAMVPIYPLLLSSSVGSLGAQP
jgi:hypothetical protein